MKVAKDLCESHGFLVKSLAIRDTTRTLAGTPRTPMLAPLYLVSVNQIRANDSSYLIDLRRTKGRANFVPQQGKRGEQLRRVVYLATICEPPR